MSESTSIESGPRSRTVVLCVDDQPMIGEAVRRMLAPHGEIEYRFLADPTKAIETAVELKPTVILQDLVMPGIDGLDLVREYRAHDATREVPIVVLSSKEEATTKAEAFARGANDYLVKLPDPIELIARVRHHSRGYVAQLERNEAFRQLAESEQHMAQELKQAARYVEKLLDPPMDRPELRTQWTFVPSASLGGDSFGYHWIDDDRFACYVLDVCGHGVGPALLSVSAVSLIRSLTKDEMADPKTVLALLNANFQMSRHNGMFFTMWYGVFDRRDHVLTWSGAGHPPALRVRGTEITRLESQGLMIGAMPEYDNPNDTIELAKGDRLYLYSDGVFEIEKRDGGMWSLEKFIAAMAEPVAGSRIDHIRALTRELSGSDQYADDYSMIEVEIKA